MVTTLLWYACHKLSQILEPRHEKSCLMLYANNKGTDQPAHPGSLIKAFVACCLDSIVSILASAKHFKNLSSPCNWADRFESYLVGHTPKTGFLMTRLISIMLSNVSDVLQWEATKTLYREMLLVFEKILLPTYASCHVQFIMFYLCSLKPVSCTDAQADLNLCFSYIA